METQEPTAVPLESLLLFIALGLLHAVEFKEAVGACEQGQILVCLVV